MAPLKSLPGFLKNDIGRAVGVLIHGYDRGGVRERAAAIADAVTGKTDDPFALVRLDDADLSADPGRLPDEVQSLSLLGGRRVIWIENAGAGLTKAIEPLADAGRAGNLVIAEAGALPKSAKLRQVFEESKSLWSLACYEDSAGELHTLIAEELAGFDIGSDAREALASLLGADRRLSRQELRKLALYCHGNGRVDLADIEAVCGDVTAFSTDALLHAAFGGDLPETSRLFHRLVNSGSAASSLLSSGLNYSARLLRYRVEMRRGRNAESLIRSARPPLSLKDQRGIARTLSLWDEDGLLAASGIVSRAILETREHALLQDQIAERAFLSLARSALQQRRAA